MILGQETGGANLSIKIGGFAFQPSEFVKIIFVFFIAGLLSRSAEFKNIVLSAVMAGIHIKQTDLLHRSI